MFRVSSSPIAQANVVRSATRGRSARQSLPFGEELGRAARQNLGTRTAHVQTPSPAPAPVSAPVPQSLHPVLHPPPVLTLAEGPAGMRRLSETMSALGMSGSGLQIRYEEEPVYYPGGSYTNRSIVVSNGTKTERFSEDLTARNPLITAAEIQRYFGVAAAAQPAGIIHNV